jgi:hypothetical protein
METMVLCHVHNSQPPSTIPSQMCPLYTLTIHFPRIQCNAVLPPRSMFHRNKNGLIKLMKQYSFWGARQNSFHSRPGLMFSAYAPLTTWWHQSQLRILYPITYYLCNLATEFFLVRLSDQLSLWYCSILVRQRRAQSPQQLTLRSMKDAKCTDNLSSKCSTPYDRLFATAHLPDSENSRVTTRARPNSFRQQFETSLQRNSRQQIAIRHFGVMPRRRRGIGDKVPPVLLETRWDQLHATPGELSPYILDRSFGAHCV